MSDSGATSLSGLREIADVGRDRVRGGYSRHLFDDADRTLREWFTERAARLGLDLDADRNGNLWAWWGAPGPNAFVTGSHLDSVPGGGAFDGPLGIVCALDAVALLQAEGFEPQRPVAIVVFAEEEGSRFGVACLGSRLLTGAITPERALALRDGDGDTLADVLSRAGVAPDRVGPDPEQIAQIGSFLEVHVEQGRALVDLDVPIGLALGILGHGRWRLCFTGEGNHAGSTAMGDRRDPMVAAAATIAAVPAIATAAGDARATVGRMQVHPGGTNVIASAVDVWLDARDADDDTVRAVVARIAAAAADRAAAEGCTVVVSEESWTGRVEFAPEPAQRIVAALAPELGTVPALMTGAGHDAGVLASTVPSAMLFVRNPTGISHAPEEFASAEDSLAGVHALAAVMRHEL